VRKNRISNRLIAGALATAIMLPAGALAQTTQLPNGQPSSAQVQQPEEGGVNWGGVGYGAGALVSNVVYIPVKLVYAVLGGLVGGAAYGLTLGNTQTADTIWRSSLGGDYVVTPDMLEGKQPLHFSGPTNTPPDTVTTTNSVQPITAPSPATTTYQSGSTATMPSSPAIVGQPIDSGSGPMQQPQPLQKPPPTLPSTTIE
jgi:hypothetical protein